jgi:4-hydroxy 2-oxovalerate aldolase
MKSINILDCTLRDGGYINNWRFGKSKIKDTIQLAERSGVDIIELGFLRNEPDDGERVVFSGVEQEAELLGEKKAGVIYSAMLDANDSIALPTEKISKNPGDSIDMFRLITWDKTLDECKKKAADLMKKGYEVCIQPTRVDQYSDEIFAELCRKFNDIEPYALYMVDSFGVIQKKRLLEYAKIADENLAPGIRLGYHAHNNLQQALINAQALIELKNHRELIIDASVMGFGRGAGNLQLELIIEYLNRVCGKSYKLDPVLIIGEEIIKPLIEEYRWGYSLKFLVSGLLGVNPDFAIYYTSHYDISITELKALLESLPNKYLYSEKIAQKHYHDFFGK